MIREVTSDEDVRRSHAVMAQLRPHLDESSYVEAVTRQRAEGYRLATLEEDGLVRAVAGFRIVEMLHQGRHLYVDDLVTDDAERSKGHGEALFEWLVAVARASDCATLELDSGVQRFRAHAFYFAQRMHISGYRFKIDTR